MNTIPCPYCNKPVPVPAGFTYGELSCKSCGQSFFIDPEPADDDAAPAAAPSDTQPIPPVSSPHVSGRNAAFPRKPAQRPPAQRQFSPSGEAIASSSAIVHCWLGFFIGASIVLGCFYGLTDNILFLWGCIFVASIVPIWFMAWVMIYVRAIAIHTAR